MPITQENALSHLHLLEDWLLWAQTRYQDHYGNPDQQSTTSRDPDQDSYQESEHEEEACSGGTSRDMSPCQAAVQKLVEYIQLNFTEGGEIQRAALRPMRFYVQTAKTLYCETENTADRIRHKAHSSHSTPRGSD